jgi:pimeloyl-ACP methyl ester carboxylesterase
MDFLNYTGTYLGADQRPSAFDITFSPIRKSDDLVMFLHGYKGFKDWGAWNIVANFFAERGFDFLKFNFSHNGGTIHHPVDFPDLDAFSKNTYFKEVYDLERMFERIGGGISFGDWHRNYNRIHLIGHSRGGGIAILNAARNARLTTLVTWAAVSDFSERFNFDMEKWKARGMTYVKNSRTGQMLPHRYDYYLDFERNRERLDIPAAAKEVEVPWLIAHGADDEAVNPSNAEFLKSLNPAAELFIMKNAGHTFGARHPWEEKHLPPELGKLVNKTFEFIRV